MKRIALALGVLAAVVGRIAPVCAQNPAGKASIGAWGFDITGMDRSVKPGDDFFDYANGAWFRNAVIPADRTSTGSFQDLAILSETRMGEIVAGLQAQTYAKLTPEEKQLRDLYQAFTDTARIDKRGLAAAGKDLSAFAAIATAEDVARAMGNPRVPAGTLFLPGIIANPKSPGEYVMAVRQSGLGMPDRDYYLKADAALATTRDAYRKYLTTMLTLAGAKGAAARADAVLALETNIAAAHWTAAERRNADKIYNPMTVAQLAAYAPGFPWAAFFAERGLTPRGPAGERVVVVAENTAFPVLAKLFGATPVAVWRDYLTVHYLHNMSGYLPRAFEDADFEFYGRTLGGQTQPLPRATRGVHLLDQRLGHPLGKLYVARVLSAGVEGQGGGARRQPAEGLRRRHPHHQLDD